MGIGRFVNDNFDEIAKAVLFLILGLLAACLLNFIMYRALHPILGDFTIKSLGFYIGTLLFSCFYFVINLKFIYSADIREYLLKMYSLDLVICRLWMLLFTIPTTYFVRQEIRSETFQLFFLSMLIELLLIRWTLNRKRSGYS